MLKDCNGSLGATTASNKSTRIHPKVAFAPPAQTTTLYDNIIYILVSLFYIYYYHVNIGSRGIIYMYKY